MDGDFYHIVQDELLLVGRPRNSNEDVLLSCVLRAVQERNGLVGEDFSVSLEQQLLCPISWGLCGL